MKLILPQAHHLVSLYCRQSTILPAKFKWAIDQHRGTGGDGEMVRTAARSTDTNAKALLSMWPSQPSWQCDDWQRKNQGIDRESTQHSTCPMRKKIALSPVKSVKSVLKIRIAIYFDLDPAKKTDTCFPTPVASSPKAASMNLKSKNGKSKID
jgi:hypothetical protein